MVHFFVGLHKPRHARHFRRACLSINSLRTRRKTLGDGDMLIDSGAFTELLLHGRYRHTPADYAAQIWRLHRDGVANIAGAVSQDYMCEPFMVEKTGLSVDHHQAMTIERYDALAGEAFPFPLLPVLQGYAPADYVRHLALYGDRLAPGAWVGVGSICKRNGRPEAILAVLSAIHGVRPDLRLHGFGVKLTSLRHPGVRALLWSADSMAWSYAARRQGRNRNCWHEAAAFVETVAATTATKAAPWQTVMPF